MCEKVALNITELMTCICVVYYYPIVFVLLGIFFQNVENYNVQFQN